MDERTQRGIARLERSVALRVTLGVLGFGVSIAVSVLALRDQQWWDLNTILPIWTLLGAGLIAWSARPQHRVGLVLTLAGVAGAIGDGTEQERSIAVYVVGSIFVNAYIAPLAHMAVAFPTGRLGSRHDRVAVVLVYVWCLPGTALRAVLRDPRELGCDQCGPGSGLQVIDVSDGLYTAFSVGRGLASVVLAIWLASILARRLRRASAPARRILRPVVAVAACVAVVALVWRLTSLLLPDTSALTATERAIRDSARAAFNVAIALGPFGFLAGLVRTRVTRSTLGELVVELGRSPGADAVRAALARALGDESLSVGYWARESRGFVDGDGRLLVPADSGQHETVVGREGEPLAVLHHDPALLHDEGLVESVVAAARLALENERLKAEVRAQVAAVEESRTRLVAAADAERRRVERDLHVGAEQRLVGLILAVDEAQRRAAGRGAGDAAALLGRAGEEARAALEELRELAQGVHPEVLSQDGLRAALAALAERCPVPVTLVAPGDRFTEAVEGCAYFVCSEALANVAKYARASSATVTAQQRNGSLRVEVRDDGVGGADPMDGSGLRGLRDRIEASGGTLALDSPPGQGTTVTAEIPLQP